MNHLDETTGLLYLDGELDDERADECRSHAAICAECRARLRALEGEGAWLRESLQADEEPTPARLLEPPPQRSVPPWIPIAALGLSACGASTVWSGLLAPWRAQAALAGFTQGDFLATLFFSGAFWEGWGAMRSMTEFLAMATLFFVAVSLLRRRLRRMTTAGALIAMTAFALAFSSSPSHAAQVERGHPSYTLPAGEEVKTDLIVLARTVRIDGDVDGDLIVWSGDATVNGHVKGDILSFGRELRVNGPVDGNVRAACQTLTLDSTVAKNAMALARQVDLEDKSSVGGTMTLVERSSELRGRVGGDLLAFGGDTEIDGSLGQNAVIHANYLAIGPHAEISGQTRYVGGRPPEVSPLAKLGSPLKVTILRNNRRGRRLGRRIWGQILKWGASFIFGMVLLLVTPRFFSDVSIACRRIMPALGFGALFLFATPIIALIVCITIVGLGVGLSALLLWGIALYAAHVFVGAWVGGRVLGASAGAGAGLGGLALGLLILQMIGLVPWIGGWSSFLVVLWGIGALALGTYRRLQPQSATSQ